MSRTVRQWAPSGALAIDPTVGTSLFGWEDDDEPREPGRIDVRGPLSETGWGATYSGIRARIAAAVAAGVRPIVLIVDSPGGEVTGLRETVAAIEAARKRGPVIAYVQGAASSAAYWLAAACDRIIAADTARIGSVGAVIAGLDMRGAYEATGARYYRWTSARTPDKAPEPGSEAGDAEAQRIVDAAGDAFLHDLGRLRGPPGDLDAIADAYRRGASLSSRDALALGWVDEVVTPGAQDHAWLMLGGDAPSRYRFPLAARAAADLPADAGDGGHMALDTPAGTAGPTGDVVTLTRVDHAALQERVVSAEGRVTELTAQLSAQAESERHMSARIDALETDRQARIVADEIRAAETAGKVITAGLKAELPGMPAELRAVVLGAIPATRPVGGPIGHGAVGQSSEAVEVSEGQAAIDRALAARKGV